MLSSLFRFPLRVPPRHFRCKCSVPDMSFYRESFARRMDLAGIKPHHSIALGVSGGPDSMALCVLTAGWKSEGLRGKGGSCGYIDGLLAIVVDHRLRPESVEEARIVQERVIKMGIRCEVSCCDWPEGRPKPGNLQEAARNMRYQIFRDICAEQQIGAVLVAHHADDQAELFILRLSRGSGVCGLAGMAFVSQLFLPHTNHSWSGSSYYGLLLVRPMLDFSKDDMYKICQGSNQMWVEDPTNQSTLFSRNCIRIALHNLPSSFRSEMKALISICRLTRLFIENICHKMFDHSLSIMDVCNFMSTVMQVVHTSCQIKRIELRCEPYKEGYSIIDLEKLDPTNVDDLCLSKFLVSILQFISQRRRPIRGSVNKLLLDYIRNLPCKTSLTAGGCYLCAAPRSKGTKIIVCYSPESPFSTEVFLSNIYHEDHLSFVSDQIIRFAKLHSDKLAVQASNISFLHAKSSEAVLREAVQLKLITQSTYTSIRLLQTEESVKFYSQNGLEQTYDSGHQPKVFGSSILPLYPGHWYHYMCRFLIKWKHHKKREDVSFNLIEINYKSEANENKACQYCGITQDRPLMIRHMIDADWLYLAKISESQTPLEDPNELLISNYMKSSAQASLNNLKHFPAAARRALPVFVDVQNLLLCIPSIGFSRCPYLDIVAEFKPRVPLGGGCSSYL